MEIAVIGQPKPESRYSGKRRRRNCDLFSQAANGPRRATRERR